MTLYSGNTVVKIYYMNYIIYFSPYNINFWVTVTDK